jgi:putative chitinase
MAQISHECDGGEIIRENMNYRAARISEIFGYHNGRWQHSARVTDAEAKALAGHPEELAERVYGIGNPRKHDLGNTEPGDGFKFRGNGMLQLTGREAHTRIGKMIGIDLVDHPEQLEDPGQSFRCALAEFEASGCLPVADSDNIVMVTHKVNGGENGLPNRKLWLRKWKVALDEEDAQEGTAPAEQINDAIHADKMPRGAEIKEPPVDPTTATTAAGSSGLITVAIDEVSKQIQTDILPIAQMFTGLKWLMAIISLALLGLAAYGLIVKLRNARRV